MNVTNIMIELLRAEKKGKLNNYFIEEDDINNIVYLSEGHYIYKISSDDFILDINKLIGKGIKGIKVIRSFVKMFKPEATQVAIQTGNIKKLNNVNAIEFVCGNDFIYINENFLKHYDKNATFEGTNGKSPLYVFENYKNTGIILPIIVKGEKNELQTNAN